MFNMAMGSIIQNELGGLYGTAVRRDLEEIIRLYSIYDGEGQLWAAADGLDYRPSRQVTNLVKKLIKKQARFMFSRTPELVVENPEHPDEANQLQAYLRKTLDKAGFGAKLTRAGRDCFIGKRVAVKLWQGDDGADVLFRPSLEFVYQPADDEAEKLQKIIFFYSLNDEQEPKDQRIWKQKFVLEDGKCYLTEAVYDGNARLIEQRAEHEDTGLDFIPAYVILNDGLTGDLQGESDVAELIANQSHYNHLKSDDADTLKFNMFPMTVVKNASGECLDKLRIAPNAVVDLQADEALDAGCAGIEKLESGFAYAQAFENSINRAKNDMYDLLDIPNISLEQLKGLMQSGKSMKALYWDLLSKSEERWQAWDAALRWLCDGILRLGRAAGEPLPDIDYTLRIEHLYPILEDEEAERAMDLQEVAAGVRSRKNYMEKWNISADGDAELRQVDKEGVKEHSAS